MHACNTRARTRNRSRPVGRHVERLKKNVACKANLPSDSTKVAERGEEGGHSYTPAIHSRYTVCVRYPFPPCRIVYLAVCNNDDAAYRELHFMMPLTDHRCEEPFKLLVVERQIRFSPSTPSSELYLYQTTESSRCILYLESTREFIRELIPITH